MNISTRLPTTGDTEWTLLVKILLTLQAGGGGSGSGSTLFGDPGGATIPGEVAYDSNGNVWVDLDPSGSHNWQKVVTAESAAAPMMVAAVEDPRMQPMVVAPLAVPTLETPTVVLPPSRSRWVKFRNALSKVTVWIATVLHL